MAHHRIKVRRLGVWWFKVGRYIWEDSKTVKRCAASIQLSFVLCVTLMKLQRAKWLTRSLAGAA